MATVFSFIIHRELTDEEKRLAAHVLEGALLRSEQWYEDNLNNMRKLGNKEQAEVYKEGGKLTELISRAIHHILIEDENK